MARAVLCGAAVLLVAGDARATITVAMEDDIVVGRPVDDRPVSLVGKGKDGDLVLRGTGVVAAEGCVQLSPEAVRCDQRAVRIRLGGGDDRLTLHGVGGDVEAGAGRDRIFLGASALSVDGGPGRDVLRGAGGRQRFDAGVTVEPDLIDGGPGPDEVSYRRRREPVFVDLLGLSGARGERDRLRRIESVTGGSARDVLRGDHRANGLFAGAGRDRLVGRGGDDRLVVFSGEADCGTGDDMIDAPRSLLRGCERVGNAIQYFDPDLEVVLPRLDPSGMLVAAVLCLEGSGLSRGCRARVAFTIAGRRVSFTVRGRLHRRLARHVRVPAVVRRALGRRHRLSVTASVRMVPRDQTRVGVEPIRITMRRAPAD